ncbi:uncharacterized protein PAN0_002c1359 [Moesziomyces antarcticus]|uniref:uncharacterized protein n=1 Tax=Pseudozyma antarctica TaxID=84753 RepID=UPI000719816C|nr:uncharacterized protein PAN0_002c1359 [Moesziomyces antarcticus]GAK63156.1 hypothetical protein PAN0_002c1359 [Moesziomyces antarcticus]
MLSKLNKLSEQRYGTGARPGTVQEAGSRSGPAGETGARQRAFRSFDAAIRMCRAKREATADDKPNDSSWSGPTVGRGPHGRELQLFPARGISLPLLLLLVTVT